MPPTKVKKPRYTSSILCCFICGKSCSKSRPGGCGVKFDLQVYTILRHVFEVPAETFQGYLEHGPEKGLKLWGFKFCNECDESYVKRCMQLYKQWEDMSRKFDNVRSEVIKMSKKYLEKMVPSRGQKKMILIEAREFILNHNYDYDHLDREKHIKPNYNGDKLALGMLLLSKLSKEHPNSSVLQPPKENRLPRDLSPSPPPLSPPVASAPPSPQQSPSRSSSPTPPPTPPFLRSVSPLPDPLEPQGDFIDDEDDLEIIIPPSNPAPVIIVPTIRPDKPPPRAKVKPVTNGREVVNRLVIENINKCSRCGWKPPLDSKAPKDDLKSHMKTAHGLSDLACPACKQPFAKFSDLAFHVKGHCHKKVREFLPIRPSMKIHQCDQCGKNFYNVSHLQRHTLKFHNKPLHSCPHCPWRSTCVKKLAKHTEKHDHNMTKLSCRRCRKTMTKLTYRRHRTRKCREMFFCNQCNAKFTNKARRQTHYLTAHRDISKPLECEKCGKTFSQLYGLLGHRRYCIGDSLKKLRQTLAEKAKQYLREGKPKRFVNCNQCGKTLSKFSLNNHIKTVHEKQVKFFCELCGQGMKSQRQLSTHQVLHHNCCGMVECKAQFENRQELYNHQIEKHQKEIYLVMCDQCPKICGERYLEVHKEVHQVKDEVNQDKPFICHICGKGFPLKRYLAKHVYDHKLRDQRALKRQQEEERGQKQQE